jgi:hypothetical protein
MAALDVVGALASVKTMLSELTAWQTICGVSSAAEAAKRIHEGGIEVEEGQTTAPSIVLDITSFPTTWKANRFHGDLAIEIRVEFEVPEENRATFSDQYVWVWGKYSDILAGIAGAVGGSGQHMSTTLETPLMPGRVDPDDNSGRCEWNFVLSLTGVVI